MKSKSLLMGWLSALMLLGGLSACGGGSGGTADDGPDEDPPVTVRGSVVRFAAAETGYTITPVALPEATRFSVSVLSDPLTDDGRFVDVDITSAAAIAGEGIGTGEFVIDTTAALATINAGRVNAITHFISSELALNVDTQADPAPAAAQAKAMSSSHFGSTLIDSASSLRVSAASSFVADRFKARVHTERASGADLGAYFARVNPQDLSATRLTLEAGISTSSVDFDFSDASVFADQLTAAGLAAPVDRDIENAATVVEGSSLNAVTGDYNLAAFSMGFYTREIDFEGGLLKISLTQDAGETPLRFEIAHEESGMLHQYTAGPGAYSVSSEIDVPTLDDFEADTAGATLTPGGSLSLLLPAFQEESSEDAGNGNINATLAFSGPATLISPASPVNLRVVSGGQTYRDVCNQSQCRDGAGNVVAGRGDELARYELADFGFLARQLAAPFTPNSINGRYGLVRFAAEFGDGSGGNPSRRIISSGNALATLTNGVGTVLDDNYVDLTRLPASGGATLSATSGTRGDETQTIQFSATSRPSLGNGQLQILTQDAGDAMLFYGFSADAGGNLLVATTSQTCAESTGAPPSLCAGPASHDGTRKPYQANRIEHLVGIKLASTAPTATTVGGQYLVRAQAIEHHADGQTVLLQLDSDSTLTLTPHVSGNLDARLSLSFTEVRRDGDAGPLRRSVGSEPVAFTGTASILADGRLDISLTSGAGDQLSLQGFPSADAKALVLGTYIEASAGAGLMDHAVVGLTYATRVTP